MVYIEERKKNKKSYFYAKESYREEGKVKTRTVSYLGTDKEKAHEYLQKLSGPSLLLKKEEEQLSTVLSNYQNFLKNLDTITKKEIEKEFMLLFINETNALEGSSFTIKETTLLLEEGITPDGKELREVYEQINTKKLFEQHKKKPFNITKKSILKIHEIFMENIDPRIGFRTREVRILGSTTKTSQAKYVPYDIDLLLSWYKTNKSLLHPIVLAAIFHAKFEQIHPFADGNGRVGRFIAFIMLEKTFPTHFPKRKQYLDALEFSQNVALDSHKREDFEEIIKYFIHACKNTWEEFYSIR